MKKLIPFILFLCGGLAWGSPGITVSVSSVSTLGGSQTISITVQLIDPNNTGMLKVPGTGIVPIMRASTVTPGTTATVGPIYGNDVILDGYGNSNTTYYQVQVFTVAGGIISATPVLQNFYAFVGSGTVDLSTATPLAPGFMNGSGGSVVIPGNFTATAGQNTGIFSTLNKTVHINAKGPYTTLALALTACGTNNPCEIQIDDNVTSLVVPAATLGPSGGACTTTRTAPYSHLLMARSFVALFLTGQLQLNCGAAIIGQYRDGFYISPCMGTNAPVTGCSTFSGKSYGSPTLASVPLVVMGDGTHVLHARVEGVTLDCNTIPTCSGIYAQGLNENSYIGRIDVVNDSGYGIFADGTNVGTGNFRMDEVTVADNGSTAAGIIFKNVYTSQLGRSTVVSNSATQSSNPCIWVTSTIANVYYGQHITAAHCEKHNDGVLVDSTESFSGDEIDVGNGTVNAVHVAATASANISVKWMHNNNTSKNVFKNDATSLTESANNPPAAGGIVTFWAWSTGIGDSWFDVAGYHPPTLAFANLGTPANGTVVYCSNCTIANPCASGGSGAIAKRLNSVWVCN
jgi:hypothetical protein